MARTRKEEVSVSFHYFVKLIERGPPIKTGPFSAAEFEDLYNKLKSRPEIDLTDERAADKLRYKVEVPIGPVELVDQRTIFGVFKASYTGHSYDNTARGKIPANSISLRPFHFLLYLSESGRIYIGCQYLGLFGGYTGLRYTINSLLPDPDKVIAHSFRLDQLSLENAVAKEIRISFSDKSTSISASNSFTNQGMIAFKKRDKSDGFEEQVKTKFFGLFGQSPDDIRKGVADAISGSGLLDVKDEDIEDCTVIADFKGKTRKLFMLENGGFASKISLDVPLNIDGHPEYEPTKKEMMKILKQEIIARKENV